MNMTSSSAGISSNIQMNQRNHKAPKFQGCVLLWICLMPVHTSTSSCEPGSLGTKRKQIKYGAVRPNRKSCT